MSLSFNGNTEFKPKFSRWLQTGKVPGGRTPHMKVVGMLVVSLRGVNFGFWSPLGCSGQTPSYLALKVSFRVAREKI